MGILIPVIILSGMGILFGGLLGIAAKAFKVEQDERIEQITELLAGANCGGCGYPGCGGFAAAIVEGKASPAGCPITDSENIAQIADLMGVTVEDTVKKVAKVMCSGTCDKAAVKYEYDGITDCVAVYRYGGGEKSCLYGCTGYGSCVRACQFDAISIQNGIAVVDPEKCTSCGMCVATCPKRLIDMVPVTQEVMVLCKSKDPGKEVRVICSAGCIGCKICERNCPTGAITVTNNIAWVNHETCTACGICVEKCPTKVIHKVS